MKTILILLSIFGFIHIKNYAIPDQNEALIVTDYLNNGEAQLARQLSSVEPFIGNIESYAGYFRVSDDCVRNYFFWYFPAQNGNKSAPLIVWLNGGPGASSMLGVFKESGPYYINPDLTVGLRDSTWTKEYNVVYFDNPVGTGFSFSKLECYLSDEDSIGHYLSICIQQFYQLFPDMKQNHLYITGESYAGKYVPAMVYAIDQLNKNSSEPMNLQGMAVGNGWTQPYYMVDIGTNLFYTGLIFDNQIEQFDIYRDVIQQAIREERYVDANMEFDKMLNGFFFNTSVFTNTTGLTNYYNLRLEGFPVQYFSAFLEKNKRKLNVGNASYESDSQLVDDVMKIDFMKSMAPVVQYILNAGYKTMFYSGQLDVICSPVLTSEFLKNLEWNGKEGFNVASQQIWYSQTTPRRVNGYVRASGNFKQILVRNAGHRVITEQPKAALEMLTNFIYDRDF